MRHVSAIPTRAFSERDMSKNKTAKQQNVLGALAGCVGEYKAASVLTSVFVVLEVVLEVFIPIIMSQIIDVGLAEGAGVLHLQPSAGGIQHAAVHRGFERKVHRDLRRH